jgi:hypothetical protein
MGSQVGCWYSCLFFSINSYCLVSFNERGKCIDGRMPKVELLVSMWVFDFFNIVFGEYGFCLIAVPLMAITTALMTYRRLNSMFYYYLWKKLFLMINLDQMPPKFYGLKLAATVFGGNEIVIESVVYL